MLFQSEVFVELEEDEFTKDKKRNLCPVLPRLYFKFLFKLLFPIFPLS